MQKHSNQHIKRKERAQDIEFARKRIRVGILIGRLNKASAGKIELTKSQLEATKMLLDKAVPSLQAIEQTQVNPLDQLSEEQLVEQAKALITAHPWLLQHIAPGPRAANTSDAQQQTAQQDTLAAVSG